MIVLGTFLFIRSIKRNNNIKRLIQSGQKLQGVVVDVSEANNGDVITVSATGPSGNVQSYTSDPVQGIGVVSLADFKNNPIPIDVYIDPADPENYYVDISDVPNLTPERINELFKSMTSNSQTNTVAGGQSVHHPTPPNNPPVEPTSFR